MSRFMRQRPEWAHVMLAFASFPLSDDCVRIGARALFELDCVCLPFWRKSLRQIKTRAKRGSPSHPLHSKAERSGKKPDGLAALYLEGSKIGEVFPGGS